MPDNELDPRHPLGHQASRAPTEWATLRANLGYVAWAQVLVATGGSLYFSEVLQFPPCVLCWYQRILMYPLVLILAAGILLRDARLRFYVLPLSVLGLLIALYHNLLTYNIIPTAIVPCSAGVSCLTRWINWFGFVTIPLLSFTAFAVITLCMIFYQPQESSNDES